MNDYNAKLKDAIVRLQKIEVPELTAKTGQALRDLDEQIKKAVFKDPQSIAAASKHFEELWQNPLLKK
jgi:hypothetical protein